MIDQDEPEMLARYRSMVTDRATPGLDSVILAAAGRHVVRVRVVRRSILALGLAVVVFLPYWGTHVVRAPQAPVVNDAGRQEGATRYYLLNAFPSPYSGSGTMEQKQ